MPGKVKVFRRKRPGFSCSFDEVISTENKIMDPTLNLINYYLEAFRSSLIRPKQEFPSLKDSPYLLVLQGVQVVQENLLLLHPMNTKPRAVLSH